MGLRDADVLITTPFWPVSADRKMLDEAANLKLILTAGVGSDHIDLGEAAERAASAPPKNCTSASATPPWAK